VLARERDRSIRLRHPWVFSGAVSRVEGDPARGETVTVADAEGRPLAVGAWSPDSRIRVRLWSFAPATVVDRAFLARRVDAARERRRSLRARTTGVRLVNAESDGLPGVVVDRYADVAVVQLLSAGADAWRDALVDILLEQERPVAVYERSDAEVRTLEGLAPRSGLLRGTLPDEVAIEEDGLRYAVDVVEGQKTGFYLDQRDNRQRVGALCAGGEVLNAFCYTGGFTLPALRAGATRVVSVDSSAEALAAGRRNVAANGLPAERAEWREADVFAELRQLRDRGARFDAIVLDPPKFAPTAQHAARATRAYKDINLLALKLLRPGGWLATFSCSGGVDAALFQKVVAGAAADAGVDAAIAARLGPGEDHAVALAFPEGDYLKGLLLRRLA
jgi:23S rRNA (cytosine1962-C5)-methyltransferase